VLLSENVPVATNCRIVLRAICGLIGVTAIDTSAGLTVKLKLPLTPLIVAVMTHWPALRAVSFPLDATPAMLESDELHVAEFVRSLLLLSPYMPVAVICCDCPAMRVEFGPAT